MKLLLFTILLSVCVFAVFVACDDGAKTNRTQQLSSVLNHNDARRKLEFTKAPLKAHNVSEKHAKHHGHRHHRRHGHRNETRMRILLRKENRLEKEVRKMKDLLKAITPKCRSQSDCPRTTCCFQSPSLDEGRCMLNPHREDQQCSYGCHCQPGYICHTKDLKPPTKRQTGRCRLDGEIVGQKDGAYIPNLLKKVTHIRQQQTEHQKKTASDA